MFLPEVTKEEEEKMINKAAEWISKYDMELAATLILDSVKHFSSLGGSLGRFFLGPFVPFIGHREDTFICTFEKKENIESLLEILEAKKIKEERKKKMEEERKKKEKGTPEKGWRRFIPFLK